MDQVYPLVVMDNILLLDQLMSSEQKRQHGITSLPSSLKDALDNLQSDHKFLEHVFTKDLLDAYMTMKYSEFEAFAQTPTAWEVSMYADA